MPNRKNSFDPHKIYVRKLEKLQRAGFLQDVNPKRKPTERVFRRMERYSGLLRGTEAAVKAPTREQARALRNKFGLRGSGKTIIVPREKGEKFRVTKGEIKSTRNVYSQHVVKTFGSKLSRPTDDVRRYYTIPSRTRGSSQLKRRTFSSFDEMLFYLEKYEVDFEDIEDRIEVEEFKRGGKRDKQMASKIYEDRAKAIRRLKKRRGIKSKRKPKKSRRK